MPGFNYLVPLAEGVPQKGQSWDVAYSMPHNAVLAAVRRMVMLQLVHIASIASCIVLATPVACCPLC
jgi:hypothetical protein